MSRFFLYWLAGLMLAGCASFSSNEVHVSEELNPAGTEAKNLASIRMMGYVDGRKAENPRKIGISEVRVSGMIGTEVMLDRDVTDIVAESMHKHLNDKGLRVLAKDNKHALFELSGVVKEFRYDVKARDYVRIKLETTLKEIATGKAVWAGVVEQKNDRFAGVSGNSTSDIADYLKQELGVVTGKTAEAIENMLVVTRPELFNLTPGTKAIPGVTVFVSPDGQGTTAPDTSLLKPPHVERGLPAPEHPLLKPPRSEEGLLVVRTEPARAKVYLDGVYYGLSPLNIDSAGGIHKVVVKLKGYKNATEKVAIRVGATTELEFQLEK